jgi:hypothetical protein
MGRAAKKLEYSKCFDTTYMGVQGNQNLGNGKKAKIEVKRN